MRTHLLSLLIASCLLGAAPSTTCAQTTSAQETRMTAFYAARKAGKADEARAILSELVAQGFPEAMAELGNAYRTGEGAEKDLAKARALLEQGASLGNSYAMRLLAWMHEKGEGAAADPAQAIAWYTRAANANDAWSSSQLGFLYWNGEGTAANGVEAVRHWKKAAQAKHANAMNGLASAYGVGRADVPADADESHFWRVRAMVSGHEGAKKALMDAGYRSPLDAMAAFNSIVQESGGRLRVANYNDDGINGGTFTLYMTSNGTANGNVVWMMDFGVKPSPELRTVIAARVRKSSRADWVEGQEWREKLLAKMNLPALSAAMGRWEGDLKP